MSTKASTQAKRGKEGVCGLTGEYGKYVKSHILPRALTRLSKDGQKIKEARLGGTPRNRPATWYDDELVIRKGEDILEEIDTPAIELLRDHTLIWSSFSCDEPFAPEDFVIAHDACSIRELSIDSSGADALRLFFLSIVWRAAASSRPEFADIQLEPGEIEDIRQRVLSQDPGPVWEYPITFDQLITRGDPHNRTPIQETYDYPESPGYGAISVPGIRIYMDGLVVQVLLTKVKEVAQRFGKLCLGANDTTVVLARSFEQSRTSDDMREVILDNIKRGHG